MLENFFHGRPVTSFGHTEKVARAEKALLADDPIASLSKEGSYKLINFAHAIMGDDPDAVAIDRWLPELRSAPTTKIR